MEIIVILFLVSLGGVSPFGTSATIWPLYQPLIIGDECDAIGGMKLVEETEVPGENFP
jgi:hypothetical protein